MHLNCETARKMKIPRVSKQKPQVILILTNGVNAHVELSKEILGHLDDYSCYFAINDTSKAFSNACLEKKFPLELHLGGSKKACASLGISHVK